MNRPQPKFKSGDKIRLVRHGRIEKEGEEYTKRARLDLGSQHTVKSSSWNAWGAGGNVVHLMVNDQEWWFHEDHFEYAKMTNEQRVHARMEKLNA